MTTPSRALAFIAHIHQRNRQLTAARAVVRAERANPTALKEAARVLAQSHKADDRMIAARIERNAQ